MSKERIENKQRVYDFSEKIYEANLETIDSVLDEYFHQEAVWYGSHPFNTLAGLQSISNDFYKPLLRSFPDMQKIDDMLLSGLFKETEGEWVSTKGHFVGTFAEDFLDIPATKGVVYIRFGEFHKIEDGKIIETRIILDILDLIRQAGFKFFKSLGVEMVYPAPATQDGILLGEADDTESVKTLKVVEDMIYGALRDEEREEGNGIDLYFHKDFMWYGPSGIGTCRGIEGFMKYHEGPFCKALPDWQGGNHITRYAEGKYCSFVGWPSIYATHTGDGLLGLPATNKKFTMRVMDFYRSEGDLLVENWVYIDMIHFLKQIGVDIFHRLKNNKNVFR
ncbi:hypothetical protein SH2C18_49350 [Clostridium sediminicola]|uniref:ester cyclase n=1 Tax=Clostridium sediminicola TaxID=3114879 RepID=UPI0031F2072C